MAKKQTESKKKPTPASVYLRKDVRDEIAKIAKKEGLSVHAVMAYGVSYFVRQYKAGKAKIETVQKPVVNLDI